MPGKSYSKMAPKLMYEDQVSVAWSGLSLPILRYPTIEGHGRRKRDISTRLIARGNTLYIKYPGSRQEKPILHPSIHSSHTYESSRDVSTRFCKPHFHFSFFIRSQSSSRSRQGKVIFSSQGLSAPVYDGTWKDYEHQQRVDLTQRGA